MTKRQKRCSCGDPYHEFVVTFRSTQDALRAPKEIVWRARLIKLTDGTVLKDCHRWTERLEELLTKETT